ncbi:tail fiber assembly protein [Xenorhabdus cabanillasii]|uniref:Tail fiber assembly protein n=2 Tax=Xenorhabdus cabanillasii TaxID=351673 RepID=W1IUZ4_9GAMM
MSQYADRSPSGKKLGADKTGNPTWVEVPPPTPDMLQCQAESRKQYLMNGARDKIAPLQDAVDLDLDIVTEAEKSILTKWRKYRVLFNRVNCSTAPDIAWPEQSE